MTQTKLDSATFLKLVSFFSGDDQPDTRDGLPPFYNINLTGLNLEDADLNGANLKGADLKYADLNGADLNGANLNGANLNGANLNGANLEYSNVVGTDMAAIYLPGMSDRKDCLYARRVNGVVLFWAGCQSGVDEVTLKERLTRSNKSEASKALYRAAIDLLLMTFKEGA